VEVDRAAGTARVALITTAPCCAYGPRMARALEDELRALPWVRECRVELRHERVWTPDLMSHDAQQRLGARRERVRRTLDVRPYDWEVSREH
jgi:metal-sulfur cluster biosynthetic enzyme